jgi:hypothetical protein
VALVVVAFSSAAPVKAAGDEARLQALVQAGEFGPALELAKAQPDRARRDAALTAVARAQASSGDKRAMYSTLASVTNDKYRQAVLDESRTMPPGGQGGGVQPDFQSLIDLLTATIAPTTWNDVGGAGAVKQFAGGVIVDTDGALRRIETASNQKLAEQRDAAALAGASSDVRKASPMRKVSLPRLERAVQLRLASGGKLDDEMLLLAGIERVQYVFVYPDTGDLVLAGPAGAWQTDPEGRTTNVDSGRPVLRLDDLIVLLRHVRSSSDGQFGCSIMPTQDGLARTQAFVQRSSGTPIKVGGRDAWLEQLRSELGAQDISVFGVDPRTRVAQVLVEADYRMKLVGIGLEPGTMDVPSYLDMIKVPAGNAPPPMDVLRWWFTMDYTAIHADPERQAFALVGQGVKVQSENEMLSARGERINTGNADELNREFAHNFTKNFAALASKYPIYAELQNVFDLALVAALVKHERIADKLDWQAAFFGNDKAYQVALGQTPKTVQTVINHRVVNRVHVLAAVSGGVTADPYAQAKVVRPDTSGKVYAQRRVAAPNAETNRWWWD